MNTSLRASRSPHGTDQFCLVNSTVTGLPDGRGPIPGNQRVLLDRVLPPAGPDHRRQPIDGQSRCSHQRTLPVPAGLYPNPRLQRRLRASTSLTYSGTGLEACRGRSILNGSDERLSGRRSPISSPGATRAAATSTPPSCRGSSRLAGIPNAAGLPDGPCRARWLPIGSVRPDPGPQLSSPASTNLLASHDPSRTSRRPGSSCATTELAVDQSRHLPSGRGPDVQGHHRRRPAERLTETKATAVPSILRRTATATGELRWRYPARRRHGVTARGVRPVLQQSRSLNWSRLGVDAGCGRLPLVRSIDPRAHPPCRSPPESTVGPS